MRTRLKNCLLFDGTGAPAIPAADILLENDRILAVGNVDNVPIDGEVAVDLKGFAVCPGFIDTHSHSDLAILDEPMIPPKIRQGITTEFFGQDGISMAPLPVEYISRWRKNIAGLEGTSDSISWEYRNTAGYLNQLEQSGIGPNACYLIPHGNVRMEAMGLGENQASDSELSAMCDILQRELDAGGFGLSTGLIYPPCTYADNKELSALCQVASDNNVPLVIHQRSEADLIIESMKEVIAIGEQTGVHVHFSHFKLCGKYNSDKLPLMLELLDDAKSRGIKVTFDQYPYVAGSTMLSAILPPWAHAGGTEELLKRLADPATRTEIINAINTPKCTWDNFVNFAGLDGISVTNVQTDKNRHTIGMTLIELGKDKGTDPLTAALDLILEEENGVSMVDFYGLEDHVRQFMMRPEMNVCTDGLMHGTPHPRTFGAFPRVLGKYCREEKLMPMEEAIRKMTSQPATVFGIPGRGRIAPDYFADLVVFDPETVRDIATFTAPRQHPDGIKLVMVNGQAVFSDSGIPIQQKDLPSGRVLRRKA